MTTDNMPKKRIVLAGLIIFLLTLFSMVTFISFTAGSLYGAIVYIGLLGLMMGLVGSIAGFYACRRHPAWGGVTLPLFWLVLPGWLMWVVVGRIGENAMYQIQPLLLVAGWLLTMILMAAHLAGVMVWFKRERAKNKTNEDGQ
ncbi:MAG: hypothetical protein OEW12_08145 [Deltaproteobacteria bacterium]|nr:hypothetical protein [Deltaproteobacteria bacterium]